jgi:hypothetical protein
MATNPARNKPTDKTDNTPEPTITIIKKATCKSLAGNSTLTYEVGKNDKDVIQLRIASNSGGGFFSDEWVTLNKILKAIKDWPADHPITSLALRVLFNGKSVNTPSFLLAALLKEGILAPVPDKKRHFQLGETKPFLEAVAKLVASHSKTTKPKPKAKAKAAGSMPKTKKKTPATK